LLHPREVKVKEEGTMAGQPHSRLGFDRPWMMTANAPVLLGSRGLRPRVLVAEDDDDLRSLLCDELRREGLEVIGCGSAREAARQGEWIGAMAGNPWSLDVVVTDLCLGEIDGLALLQRVAHVGVDVPVVLISAFGDVGARARASEFGAAAFLDKPVEMDRLRSLVRHLARDRQQRQRVRARGRSAHSLR
jgi:DNA-binding NtrC family response regulator